MDEHNRGSSLKPLFITWGVILLVFWGFVALGVAFG